MKVLLELSTDESKIIDNLLNSHLSQEDFGDDDVRVSKVTRDEGTGRYSITLTK